MGEFPYSSYIRVNGAFALWQIIDSPRVKLAFHSEEGQKLLVQGSEENG
jgi:hypothetical protein